jgi:DNA-binding NtrC family response regulator
LPLDAIMALPRRPRVLVVDAEPLGRWAVREALSAAGFEAIELDPNLPIPAIAEVDVLVLDATLAGTSSLRILETIRRGNPRCRVVLLTSFDAVGFARVRPGSASWRAVQKPFDVARVVEATAELADEKGARRVS